MGKYLTKPHKFTMDMVTLRMAPTNKNLDSTPGQAPLKALSYKLVGKQTKLLPVFPKTYAVYLLIPAQLYGAMNFCHDLEGKVCCLSAGQVE